jgi:aspartate-semialdehyde dehydrogenase
MNKEDIQIAVVGATGNVGISMLQILHEHGYDASQVYAVASKNSTGKQVSFGEDHVLEVKNLEDFDFNGIDVALFSAGGKISEQYVPKAVQAHCVVIDNSSYFRMNPDIPLVVPEVNANALKKYDETNIIANPNCSTIQLAVVLGAFKDLGIRRVITSTYQSVSGAGKEAMDELFEQTKGVFMNSAKTPEVFQKPIAFNVIPQIDHFMEDGFTKEEWKMRHEIKKIVDEKIGLSATCVRVPVFVGHSVDAYVELENPTTVEELENRLSHAPGVKVVDDKREELYSTPVECVGEDDVLVSRLRKDPTHPNAFRVWIVSDNVRKGAALNAVHIFQLCVVKITLPGIDNRGSPGAFLKKRLINY